MKLNLKIYCVLCLTIIALVSCQSEKKKRELGEKERQLQLREQKLLEQEYNKQHKPTKYIYIAFTVKKPIFNPARYITVPSSNPLNLTETRTIPASITHTNTIFKSEILRVSEYDEDKGYEYMDNIESEFKRVNLSGIRSNISAEIMIDNNAVDNIQRLEKQVIIKILKRELKVFDSYREASISRKKD